MAGEPVERRFIAHATGNGIEVEHQRFAGLRVAPVRPTGFGQELARFCNGFAPRLPIDPVINHRIDRRLALAIAENPRRQRPHRRNAAPVQKDRDEFLLIDGNRQRLPQLARPFFADAILATDYRVEHVEAHVEGRGPHAGQQADSAFLHVVGEFNVAPRAKAHGLIETIGGNSG